MTRKAIDQSIAYHQTHRISADEPILFGFRDGGRHLPWDAQGEPLAQPFREVILAVAPAQDLVLGDAITAAGQACAGKTRLEEVDILADLVAEYMREGDTQKNFALLEEMAGDGGLAGAQITLGQMIAARTGVCRHRSLLFKIFADALGIPCALVRGDYALPGVPPGGHAWNEVMLETGEWLVVDVMNRFVAALDDPVLFDYADMEGGFLYRGATRDKDVLPPDATNAGQADVIARAPWTRVQDPDGRAGYIFLDAISDDAVPALVAALDACHIRHDRLEVHQNASDDVRHEVLRVRGAFYPMLRQLGARIRMAAPPAIDYPLAVEPAAQEGLLEDAGEVLEQRTVMLSPTRLVWGTARGLVNPQALIAPRAHGPVEPMTGAPCILFVDDGDAGGVLLDFGRELNGCVEIGVARPAGAMRARPSLRVRFGESAAEAMSELGERASGNDYAVRDQVVTLPWRGTKLIGPSGFRFVRLDAVDPSAAVPVSHVQAHCVYPAQAMLGNFSCSDPLLTQIWETAAHTVRLNCQGHVLDGIKRDRLVWAGDLHPMTGVIQALFGPGQILPRSLDLLRDATPPDQWMNGICGFSLWWLLVQERWWLYSGDRSYLEVQGAYIEALCETIIAHIDASGIEAFAGGMRFIDWPSAGDERATSEGLQALAVLALDAAERLLGLLGRSEAAGRCGQVAERARRAGTCHSDVKAVIALGQLAGIRPSESLDALVGEAKGVTAYLGYYVLEALGRAGRVEEALSLMRAIWGGMIARGATSFWEEFDVEWLEQSGRIDELPRAGERDIHGDTGRHGHAGFRKSLCHGWSAGPAAFLSEHVLGVTIAEPGCAALHIAPKLGDLDWAQGSYPTPLGLVAVRAERQSDGTVRMSCTMPQGMRRADRSALML